MSAGDVRGVSKEWLLVFGDWIGEWVVWCAADRLAGLGDVDRCAAGRGAHSG